MIRSQRELNTTENHKHIHTLSKTTYDKHQEVKRYKNLIQEKAFMHQYIMQMHIISLNQQMTTPLTWISRIKALLEFFLLQRVTPLPPH